MASGKIVSSQIKMKSYEIPNDADSHRYDYPSGISINNGALIGARVLTKYDSIVDGFTYSDYFGQVRFHLDGFYYKPNVAGNAVSITFVFCQI